MLQGLSNFNGRRDLDYQISFLFAVGSIAGIFIIQRLAPHLPIDTAADLTFSGQKCWQRRQFLCSNIEQPLQHISWFFPSLSFATSQSFSGGQVKLVLPAAVTLLLLNASLLLFLLSVGLMLQLFISETHTHICVIVGTKEGWKLLLLNCTPQDYAGFWSNQVTEVPKIHGKPLNRYWVVISAEENEHL